jgi:hypothetical protein
MNEKKELFLDLIRISLPPFGESSKKSTNDPPQVLNIMKSTNFCEVLSLIYGILIHETDNNSTNQAITDNNSTITAHEKTFVINSMILLNTLAILDLDTFQVRIKFRNLHFAEFILILDNSW